MEEEYKYVQRTLKHLKRSLSQSFRNNMLSLLFPGVAHNCGNFYNSSVMVP